MTKASQPNTAFLRCCALQRPARAARFCFCTGSSLGRKWHAAHCTGRRAPVRWGLPVERWGAAARGGAASPWRGGRARARTPSPSPASCAAGRSPRAPRWRAGAAARARRARPASRSRAGPRGRTASRSRSRKSFTNASATLSAWRATLSMTSSAFSSGMPRPISVSPARSERRARDLVAPLPQRHDDPELLGAP